MCSKLEPTRRKKVTVYKVVAVKKNRRKDIMYSPITEMRYRVGKVPKIRSITHGNGLLYFNLLRFRFLFLNQLYGKTSGFTTRQAAKCFLFFLKGKQRERIKFPEHDLKVAKLVLSENIHKGTFGYSPFIEQDVFAGEFIESIELI